MGQLNKLTGQRRDHVGGYISFLQRMIGNHAKNHSWFESEFDCFGRAIKLPSMTYFFLALSARASSSSIPTSSSFFPEYGCVPHTSSTSPSLYGSVGGVCEPSFLASGASSASTSRSCSKPSAEPCPLVPS